ncbi:hypothetical protein [Bradyrhizobium prioriisuperbiae]|uniref:hypothetical protein n=1 Tax=Bradyrhizobium prioriisuperbiae TaxID=2854389 RepID=UPI0028E4E095|nr:hypothetical protein [Bradyrhizobium prioritasuperba]
MLEQRKVVSDGDDSQTTQADLDRTLMTTFCRVLDGSRLPPMAVMRMMAEALGSVYRQVAAAHQNQSCPCGWQPTSERDIETMLAAVGDAAMVKPAVNLELMETVGRA